MNKIGMHSTCAYRRLFCLRAISQRSSSSFNIDLVQNEYVKRVEWAAANFGNKGSKYTIVLPPPNVTGKLHLGHALTAVIEDTLCRHHRIKGGVAEWIPGFDHAGIATQSLVERKLWTEQNLTRAQMSKNDILKHCQQWSHHQAVTRAFCNLHKQKLIYRDKRLVHWCPSLKSSLSDQEVERLDISADGRVTIPSPNGGKRQVEVGKMYVVKYPLEDGRHVDVGTTRPETIFADVALAVHPNDERYKHLVGRRVRHPIIVDRCLPIIADLSVIPEKGTGVLKITPAHDFLDYDIYSRNSSYIVDAKQTDLITRCCIDVAGKLINVPSEYEGLDRFDARIKIVGHLSALELLGESITHDKAQINICSRTGDVIEPRLTEQWFMKTQDLHADVAQAIKTEQIKLHPSFYEGKLHDWLKNEEPWCLSRQLDWGHRIPVYSTDGNLQHCVVAETRQEAIQMLNCERLVQDNDVLDTWFSSALVPLVVNGWLDNNFNPSQIPLNLMETGWDILGFWVVRMIAMTMRLTNQVPFPTIVLHGLIRDQNGRKMSKSLGNVIDPLDVLNGTKLDVMLTRLQESALDKKEKEKAADDLKKRYPEGIPKSGADALRFALLRHDVLASDIPLSIVDSAGEGLRFCNKLWNLVNYMETVIEKCDNRREKDSDALCDRWIMSKLAETLTLVEDHMNSFAPHLAFNALHQFILGNLCDVYLESTKQALWTNDASRLEEIKTTLLRVVQPVFVQLSVFMPFVAEHLYEKIFKREPGSIYFDFVKPSFFALYKDEELNAKFEVVLAAVSAVRSIRQQLQLSAKMEFEGILISNTPMEEYGEVLHDLGALRLISTIKPGSDIPRGYMPCPIPGSNDQLALKIEDMHKEEFLIRLKRLLQKAEQRKNQFAEKSRKYREIVQRDSLDKQIKESIVLKSLKKAQQAELVVKNCSEESERLRNLLTSYESSFASKYMANITNLNKPKDAFEQLEDEEGTRQGFCHIRIQQRTGRKTITTVQGVAPEYDLKKIVRYLKKEYSCNGTIVEHPEYGEVMQFTGDQRQQIKDFLVKVGIVKEDNCKVHGF